VKGRRGHLVKTRPRGCAPIFQRWRKAGLPDFQLRTGPALVGAEGHATSTVTWKLTSALRGALVPECKNCANGLGELGTGKLFFSARKHSRPEGGSGTRPGRRDQKKKEKKGWRVNQAANHQAQ